jgi:hypothetical protein
VFKVCARCGQEYQSWATECTDCRVPLDLAPGEALASGESLAPETRTISSLVDLVVLRLGEPRSLQVLAESLQDHGISSQIDTYPLGSDMAASRPSLRGQAARLGLYVGRADVDAAREIAEELAAQSVPDAAGEAFSEPGVCPACGEPTPENATACAACGLEFPEVPAESA